jgi:hypothetical protein
LLFVVNYHLVNCCVFELVLSHIIVFSPISSGLSPDSTLAKRPSQIRLCFCQSSQKADLSSFFRYLTAFAHFSYFCTFLLNVILVRQVLEREEAPLIVQIIQAGINHFSSRWLDLRSLDYLRPAGVDYLWY